MTLIAALGIIITSAALYIVLSGFSGLKDYSLEFSSFVDPDLKIVPQQGKSFLVSNDNLLAINKIKGVTSYSKIIEESVIVEFDGKRQIVTLKGVDDNYNQVTQIDTMIFYGKWFSKGSNQVVTGLGISNNLSIGIFDYAKAISISVPKPGKGQISSVKSAFNTISTNNSGIFDINEELNNEYIFSSLETAKHLLNYKDNQVSSLEIKLDKGTDETLIKEAILTVFNNTVDVKDRSQLNDALYKMLNTENIAVYLIFTLVIIIALFNVIGALIMMILDKKASVTTLFNLGTTAKDIRKIFFLQGSLMTVLGGFIGLILGVVIVFLQQQFSLIMITPSLPYPVAMKLFNFLIVLATIIILGVLASKLASRRITKNFVNS
ncbi:ABC transporter permease [Ichthyenterobacterium magnum]|nr:FtsX-like permease family protein [Ichthyenterobacterium magnum]